MKRLLLLLLLILPSPAWGQVQPAPVRHARGLNLLANLGARIRAVNARPENALGRAKVKAVRVGDIQASYLVSPLAPSWNQLQFGNCWAGATGGVAEDLLLAQGISVVLSRQIIINFNTDGYGCNGGDVSFDFLQAVGTCLESLYPYVGCKPFFPPKAPALPYKLASWAFVGDDESIPSNAAMQAAILTHGPIAVGVAAGEDWDEYQGSNSVISGNGVVNHEVEIVGWTSINGVQVWVVKNDWGTTWGNNGQCYVRFNTGSIGTGAAFASVAVAPTPAPAPAPAPQPAPSPSPSPAPAPSPQPTPAPTPGTVTITPVSPFYLQGFGFIEVQGVNGIQLLMFPANQPAQAAQPAAKPQVPPRPAPRPSSYEPAPVRYPVKQEIYYNERGNRVTRTTYRIAG